MGEMLHSLMRDPTEDSNTCTWSYAQPHTGFTLHRDFLKQKMLQHEAVFKNQVYQLHRLYRTQKSLMDQVRGTTSQACTAITKTIHLDIGGQNTTSPPFEHSKPGTQAAEKLFPQRPNHPLQCQESLPLPSSGDVYSLYQRNILPAQRHWLETNTDRMLPGQRTSFEWEACQRNHQVSYDTYVESSVASNAPTLSHGYLPDSVRPWSHWISSWENPCNSSVQKSLPHQNIPFLNFTAQARAGSSCDFDGLYQGFSSGSKESSFNFPSGYFNHLNNGPKGAVTDGSLNEALKHRSLVNLQGPKKQECGLPWIKPKPSSKNEITNGGLNLNVSAYQFMDASDTGDSSNNLSTHNGLKSASCSNGANLGQQAELADSQSNRKILGFAISQKYSICEEHPSLIPSYVCITDQPRKVDTFVKQNVDITLPSEASVSEAVVVDKEDGIKAATDRLYIDLNLCASGDEDFGLCSNPRTETKATTLIDLEAPPALEHEEEREKLPKKRDEKTLGSVQGDARDSVDDLIKVAAEALVTISLSHHWPDTDEAASSSTDAISKDPLSWFVNTIASCGNDLENKIDVFLEASDCEGCPVECSSSKFDYFEAMTLNLPQSKEEDYMPKTLVPDNLNFDGTGSMGMTANRPRRGQARRGRPRRDFQRDILPGLPSLSRLEVTEDLQMFGGLIEATGYSWNVGVARRSSNRGGSSRGRKRLVSNIRAPVYSSLTQPVNNNNVKMVGLEDRSFTGWGNATRRPRRQRCPAGTPPTVILT